MPNSRRIAHQKNGGGGGVANRASLVAEGAESSRRSPSNNSNQTSRIWQPGESIGPNLRLAAITQIAAEHEYSAEPKHKASGSGQKSRRPVSDTVGKGKAIKPGIAQSSSEAKLLLLQTATNNPLISQSDNSMSPRAAQDQVNRFSGFLHEHRKALNINAQQLEKEYVDQRIKNVLDSLPVPEQENSIENKSPKMGFDFGTE